MANPSESHDQYSKVVGFIYVFNLIVGTGALTMPEAFGNAGWLISLILVIILAFMSFLTLTFMTEAMAITNAKIRFHQVVLKDSPESLGCDSLNTDERQPLIGSQESATSPSFEITQRVEMSVMASMYFNKVGLQLFNLCMILYLYGDLAIYAAAVPKSMRDVVCTYTNNNTNASLHDDEQCWNGVSQVNRMDAYRIFVVVFLLLIGPFAFFNTQKTKYLQIMTSLARWISFVLMIILASVWLAKGKGTGKPAVIDISGVPNLFGVCVYSFMCHHSIPSMITPIRNKSRLYPMLAGNYILITVFYMVLSFTAVFAIGSVDDLYTLNFRPNDEDSITNIVPFQYFLALFPVFTLSTNFPIIVITLRNNLIALFMLIKTDLPPIIPRFFCPLLALLPPIAIATVTNQVQFLVGITGSYAGAGIQYAIPTALVYYARKDIVAIGRDYKHKSPFNHTFWVILTLTWTFVSVSFVTVNHILVGK